MMDSETIAENDLAEMLGIGRKALAQARAELTLAEPDIERKKNGAVAYSPDALPRLCAHLRIPLPPFQKKQTSGPVALEVVRAARLNRRIVFAREKEGGAEIAVRVRDAGMFVPGQRIYAVVNGQLGTLHGPHPCRRGKPPD